MDYSNNTELEIMPTQPEQVLEDNLVAQLVNLGYGKVTIKDEKNLLVNLKSQLEKHNTPKTTETAVILNLLTLKIGVKTNFR